MKVPHKFSFKNSATYSLQSRHVFRQPQAWILRGPVGRFGFDGWGRLSSYTGAAVGAGPVDKQGPNQALLIAFPVLRRNDLQADDGGVHGVAEHFLGSGKEVEGKRKDRKRGVI